MRSKALLGMMAIGILAIVGGMILSGIDAEDERSLPVSSLKETNSHQRGVPLVGIVADLHNAKGMKDADVVSDPDSYWDPKRTGRAYRDKVFYHHQINQFLTSSRRDDPAYREVMGKLLENGYGVSEWIDFVGVASQYHLPVSLAKAQIRSRGLLPDQAEEALVPVKAHQEQFRSHVYEHCHMVMGISDRAFVDELLAIELPYAPGDQVLGTGPVILLPGDRLNTDRDWIDEEFLAAAERYTGNPRERRDLSEPVFIAPAISDGELPATRFEVDEDSNF